jgi:hypothetical protein
MRVLKEVFGATTLFVVPKEIPLNSTDKAKSAYELGHFATTDHRLIGLYRVVLTPKVWLERNKVGLRRLLRNVYKYDVDGAIIVSTPQDVALLDAVKGVNMFRKVNVPILGIIENMSYFVCPHCGRRTDIFSHGGGERESKRLGVPFLGEVPLDVEIRVGGDVGQPIVEARPDSPNSKAFFELAERVRESATREEPTGVQVHI